MTTGTLPYEEQARVFLRQARDELGRQDLRQAAEKGWGAAAQGIKAVAQRRGWEHHRHQLLRTIASRLAEERMDEELAIAFGMAEALHTSFYEGGETQFTVELRLRQVELLLNKLESY